MALFFSVIYPGVAAERQVLHGHVPAAVARFNLQPTGQLPATKSLHLAIGLPLRNQKALTDLIQQLYDPASSNYHQYLTLEQFTEQFGPTEQDYQKVIAFAKRNGLTVTGTSANRVLLDVSGSVADIEKAFQMTMRTYRHPAEARDFFAPDTEPTVDAALPVVDIQGLSDFSRPHPKLHRMDAAVLANTRPKNGSAPDGSGNYFGNDFRNAYVPGTTLTGAGQMVGLVEFDGFYSSDIAAYAAAAGNGRTSIIIQTVLLDGYNGVPTTGANSGNGEVSLDIEMAMAMAPGLAKIVVFEADPINGLPNDILNAMLTDSNTVKNLSCSWGWSGGPSTTTDTIFTNMAAVGQSFFNASGDSDAFTTGASSVNGVDNTSLYNAPSSSPYITLVGGTTLTMTGTGASYASETVWNWGYDPSAGGYVGSSGGISSHYPIPSWQTNVNNLAGRGGSTSLRNIPDVALTADNVFVDYGNGSSDVYGGTSCAAPLWAGFMALVNQQAAASGKSSAGFINPAIYAIAAGPGYSSCFNDITTGNNTWPSSPNLFYATNGYDLCTGWGTPNGTNLINALAGPTDTLVITPASGFAASGAAGGPFNVIAQIFLLTNSSAASLNWTLANTSLWLNVSPGSGTLASGSQTTVIANLNSAASNLAVGTYSASVWFTNLTSGGVQGRQFTLQVFQPLAVSPTNGFTSSGPIGGSFSVTKQNFSLTNLGTGSLNWSVYSTASWLTASPNSGALAAGRQTTLTVSLNSTANSLAAGTYNANVVITNQNGGAVALPFILLVGQPLVQNGGFEAGTFTNWTQSGNISYTEVTSGDSEFVHSGNYGAELGPYGPLGYLSQTLPTFAGQNYLLSLWLDSPNISGTFTPNEFSVSWNGGVIFDQLNIGKIGWTNLQFIVTATGSSTVLQLGFRDDPYYFGLDDINVWPIPNPSFRSVAKTGTNAVVFGWNSLAGIAYQIQYSTNLFKTNWIILSTNTATGSILTFTNSYGTDRQRFYRIRQLP